MEILDILVRKKIISEKDVPAISEEVSSSGDSIENVLLRHGVKEAAIFEAKGEYLQIPVRNLDDHDIPFNILQYIPEESAIHYKMVPVGVADNVLEVGIVDPDNIEARDVLNFISSKARIPYKLFLISETDYNKVLQSYKSLSGEVNEAISDLKTELSSDGLKEIEMLSSGAPEEISKTADGNIVEDAPVTKIVATILRYAVEGDASDVHIEPLREEVRVRFRVDGVLNTSIKLPIKLEPAVVARIKILSNMKLDEKRKPQDGRFTAKIEGRKIDFRVSTFPVYYGEKVEMRILDKEKGVKKLDEMGFSPRNLAYVRESITRPYGLILISGPTGSGKSTTLYSMLNEIDRDSKNVLSLEDPIEYNIDGVSQSQVHPEIGYTFANGLRTTLRQDPNVIMVGEIRDKETAQLAIQAALTGHLVLSTIHTNNAVGVVPRLIDMGVDPYLIPPTLNLAIAQRLVNVLAPGAGESVPVDGSLKIQVDKQFSDLPEQFKKEIPFADSVYKLKPTPESPTGTRGRTAVFEIMKMDKDIEAVILKSPVESEIYKAARAKGMLTMKEDALIKAFRKEIPLEEFNKL